MSRPTRPRPPGAKLLSRPALERAVRAARRRGERIVLTNGCFDLLHVGHVRSRGEARSRGDRLVVAVNDDASVRRLKGAGRPVVPGRQRRELLAALECVDWVTGFRGDSPLPIIRALRPDVLAKGAEYARHEIVGADDVERWGGKVVRLREVAGIRTSAILARSALDGPTRGGAGGPKPGRGRGRP